MEAKAITAMVCSRGDESHNTYKAMAYSIASGRYFYEEGGDYFSFNALIDEMDHFGAGTFKNGQRIKDQSFNPSPGFFVLDNVQNFSGTPWSDGKFDRDYWDVKSYFDSDSGITKDEISGKGYDNGLPSLTPYGMKGEVKVDGSFWTFNTRDQLDFVQPPALEPTPVAPAPEPTPAPVPTPTPEPTSSDLNADGFIDESSTYKMWTTSGGVDLTNQWGRKFSDNTSRMWDAEKAIQTDSGFSILMKHERTDGKYKIWEANANGTVISQSKWMSDAQMVFEGYEDFFAIDLNGDSIIGKPVKQDNDGDGFVDGVANYQIYTTDDRDLFLRNRNGRRIFSDQTSRQWDAVKVVVDDSSIQTLIEGTAGKEGKYKIWTSSQSNGNLMSQTRWLTGDAFTSEGYESVFNYDINSNGVIEA